MSTYFTLKYSNSLNYPVFFFRNNQKLWKTERKKKCLEGDDCLQEALTGGEAEAVVVPREVQEGEEKQEVEAGAEEKEEGKGMERWEWKEEEVIGERQGEADLVGLAAVPQTPGGNQHMVLHLKSRFQSGNLNCSQTCIFR